MYTRKAAWVAAGTLFFGLFDILTTYYGLKNGMEEVNPIPAAIIRHFGVDIAVLLIFPWLKVIFVLVPLPVIFYCEKKWPKIVWLPFCIYCSTWVALFANIAIVIFNTAGLMNWY